MPEVNFLNLDKIAAGLRFNADGIWYSQKKSTISYPDNGNCLCAELEESSFWFAHRNNCILSALETYPPDVPFFDIGGGNGFVTTAIFNSGLETILLEPGADAVKIAKSRGLEQIVCSTLEDAEFSLHSLPSVGMFDVLEHIYDDESFLIQLKSLIRPNGRLYLTVPAYSFLWSNEDEYARHKRRYSLSSLTEKLSRCEFNIEYKTYIFRLLPIPIFFIRTLPFKMGLRTSGNLKFFKKEHSFGGTWIKKLLHHLMQVEIRNVLIKKKMGFGGSCLVVARSAA